MHQVDRNLAPQVLGAARTMPSVTLTGPRQSGETTLCRTLFSDLATFQRFVQLCAGRTAQLLNYSSLAGDCGSPS